MEGVAESRDFIYNESERAANAKTKDTRFPCREKERRHA